MPQQAVKEVSTARDQVAVSAGDDRKFWIFSFGVSSPLRAYYVKIYGPDSTSTRMTMIAGFGRAWGSQYYMDTGAEYVAKYHKKLLIELTYDREHDELARYTTG